MCRCIFLLSLLILTLSSFAQNLPGSKNYITIDLSNADSLQNRANSNKDQFSCSSSAQSRLDSLKSKLSHRIDSLATLDEKSSELTEEIKSISSLLDSLNRFSVPGDSTIEQQLMIIQSKVQKLKSLETKANGKLNLFSENGGNVPQAFDVNLPSVAAPSVEGLVPNVNTDLSLPTDGLNLSSKSISSPELSAVNPNMPIAPGINAPSLNGIEKLQELQTKSNEVGQFSEKVQGYNEDVSALAQGNPENIEQLSEDLESKVAGLEEVSEIKKYTDMANRYEDPLVMKEEMLNKAKEQAVNHFAGHEEELKKAMEQFAKIRARQPDAEGVMDMLKKRSNPMKGLPLRERIVPGFSFQFQKPNSLWLDLNPQLTYRLSGRLSLGAGWNERIAYSTKSDQFKKAEHIYGPRSYVHFKLKSGVSLKGEIETMRTNVPVLSSQDQLTRDWVWSYFGGIKKDFQFTKSVMGNVQLMYNLVNHDHRSPYANRFNVRMGFEFQSKNKTKN